MDYLYAHKNDYCAECMLSKNDIKTIKSLGLKKTRNEKGLFLAEGHKLVEELLKSFECVLVAGLEEWISGRKGINAARIECVSQDQLRQASLLQAPQDVIAVFRIPKSSPDMGVAARELVLALDTVQDPGNLGTIVRIADWFGIREIFCSQGTADIYNPKAVQATMGAMARVRVHYVDLEKELAGMAGKVAVYGTFLDGRDMYECNMSNSGIIVMGNEGNGISPKIARQVTDRIYIPNWPKGAETSESLNVAVATSIICAEFRRRAR